MDVAESTSDRISGSAECDAMRWVDAMDVDGWGTTQPYVEGEPLFDMEATFEATPVGNAQTS